MSRFRINLDADQEARFRSMWTDPDTRAADIAEAFGISHKGAQRLAKTFGLGRKAQGHRVDEWPKERVELLKTLWADGLSASQIAARIPGLTRNSVIAKIHRLGLSGRAKPSKPQLGVFKAPRQARVATAAPSSKPRAPVQPKGVFVLAPANRHAEPQPPRTIPKAEAFLPLPGVEPVSFLEREGARCRWPIERGDGEHWCCGAPTADVTVRYCVTHDFASISAEEKAKRLKKALKAQAMAEAA